MVILRKYVFPWPPSVNHYYKRGRNGRVFIGKAGQDYRAAVRATVLQNAFRTSPIRIPVRMELLLYPPDRRRRDIDNILKALLDAMQHAAVYTDDNVIKELSLKMRERTRGAGEVLVVIGPLE